MAKNIFECLFDQSGKITDKMINDNDRCMNKPIYLDGGFTIYVKRIKDFHKLENYSGGSYYDTQLIRTYQT